MLGIQKQFNSYDDNEYQNENNDRIGNSTRSNMTREINLSLEKSILQQLPVMSTAAFMIQDIEETSGRMVDFRQYLLNRIDNDELSYPLPSAMVLAIKPNALNIHILSYPNWPLAFLSPTSFSRLKLPLGLSVIAHEFGIYYENTNKEKISYINKSKYNDTYTSINMSNRKHGSGNKKLLWCHGLGTVILSCRIQLNKNSRSTMVFNNNTTLVPSVTLMVSTPQAAVLLAFESKLIMKTEKKISSDKDRIEKSMKELSDITELDYDELNGIILSLCHHTLPLLSKRKNSNQDDVYYLSDSLLSGALGGVMEGESLVACKVNAESTINVLHEKLIRTWRNSMIDACIIRTLKNICREGSSEFVDPKGNKLKTTMTTTAICAIVKRSLETKSLLVLLFQEEIIGRCNFLVKQGVIDIIRGFISSQSHESSFGYSYLPVETSSFDSSTTHINRKLLEDEVNDVAIARQNSNKSNSPKYGQELFIQLCDVLNVNHSKGNIKSDYNNYRISKEAFTRSFVKWMSSVKFDSAVSMQNQPVQLPLQSISPNKNDFSLDTSIASVKSSRDDYESKNRDRRRDPYFQSARPSNNSKSSPSQQRGEYGMINTVGNKISKLCILNMKLSYVYQASLQQIDKLKRQHRRTFGLDNLSKVYDAQNESTDRHSIHHYRCPDGDEDIYDINRTVFENLPVHLIRLVLKSFFAIQEDCGSEECISDPSVVDEKLKIHSNDSSSASSDNMYGYQIGEDDMKGTSVVELKSEYASSSVQISLLANSGDKRSQTDCVRAVHDMSASELPTEPSLQSSLDMYHLHGVDNMSKEELTRQIASLWGVPVKISEHRVNSLQRLSYKKGPRNTAVDTNRCKDAYRENDIDGEEDIDIPVSHFQAIQAYKNTNASVLFFLNLLDHINGKKNESKFSQGKFINCSF